MICIQSQNTDPYHNLAAEEYLLKNFQENCFMLYRNDKAVIIGKHQNALKEINIEFARKKGIKIARRISGGGTVYHDMGNLNFTFIISGKEGHLIDFKRFTMPIVEVLRTMNIYADFDGRNGLVVNGKKFSGNAEHVWKNRTLHHGTLLFSSELGQLSEVLKVNPEKYKDKAVKSVRSQVTNIGDLINEKMKISEFQERIMLHILESTPGAKVYDFNQGDLEEIEKLRKEKFLLWEWNIGYSPKYVFKRKIKQLKLSFEIELKVEKGIIKECMVVSENNLQDLKKLEIELSNCRHDPEALRLRLTDSQIFNMFEGFDMDDFVNSLF